jgi:hypothetical protein
MCGRACTRPLVSAKSSLKEGELFRGEAHFMTSLSDGSSDCMSDVSLSRCWDDISGNGAE